MGTWAYRSPVRSPPGMVPKSITFTWQQHLEFKHNPSWHQLLWASTNLANEVATHYLTFVLNKIHLTSGDGWLVFLKMCFPHRSWVVACPATGCKNHTDSLLLNRRQLTRSKQHIGSFSCPCLWRLTRSNLGGQKWLGLIVWRDKIRHGIGSHSSRLLQSGRPVQLTGTTSRHKLVGQKNTQGKRKAGSLAVMHFLQQGSTC